MSRRLISTGSPFERTAGYSRAVIDGDFAFVVELWAFRWADQRLVVLNPPMRGHRHHDGKNDTGGAKERLLMVDRQQRSKGADRRGGVMHAPREWMPMHIKIKPPELLEGHPHAIAKRLIRGDAATMTVLCRPFRCHEPSRPWRNKFVPHLTRSDLNALF